MATPSKFARKDKPVKKVTPAKAKGTAAQDHGPTGIPFGMRTFYDPNDPDVQAARIARYEGTEWTREERLQVQEMAGYGLPDDQIARMIRAHEGGIGTSTLQKHFKDDLDCGRIEANSKVVKNLFQIATGDGPQALAASIYWTKARMGWREKQQVELTGPDGGPIQVQNTGVLLIPVLAESDWERTVSEQQRKLVQDAKDVTTDG